MQVLRDCYASLTPREREVMALVVSGLLNKQVGGELGISEITVKAHRGQVMRKMNADSLADLVTMAARLGLREPRNTDRPSQLHESHRVIETESTTLIVVPRPGALSNIERAVQLGRAFPHRDQPQPACAAQSASIEADAVI